MNFVQKTLVITLITNESVVHERFGHELAEEGELVQVLPRVLDVGE